MRIIERRDGCVVIIIVQLKPVEFDPFKNNLKILLTY